MNTYTLARPEHQPLQPNPHDHCSSSYDSSESSTPSTSSSRNSSLSIEGTLPLTPEATNSNSNGFVFPNPSPSTTSNPSDPHSTPSNTKPTMLMHQLQPTILHPPHPHSSPRFGRAHQPSTKENQLNRVRLEEMMNLIERQREESRRDDDEAEEEEEDEDEDEEEEESTVCVNIVMTVKPEWIDEVKFLIKSGKKWAEAHERGLLTFRATVGVDNPCEIRLFQEFANLDAYRDHESNPFNQEMVNGLADYLEEDMVFIEGEEFAL